MMISNPKKSLATGQLTFITIVSLIFVIVIISLSNFAFAAAAGVANFSWLPNMESDLAGYKIHYGTAPGGPYNMIFDIGNPLPVAGRIHGSVSGLNPGLTYYFVATAYNLAGLESNYSSETNYTYGTVIIAGGAPDTTTQYVTLTFAPENNVIQMRFSNNNFDWSIAETYSSSKIWRLSDGPGVKTVSVQFQDESGAWSPGSSDTIELTLPENAPATPTGLQIIAIY